MSDHENTATNKELKRLTDYAIKERQRYNWTGNKKEYSRLVREQSQMMDQMRRERKRD